MATEVIRSYGSRASFLNGRTCRSLSESEIANLAVLNDKLNLKLDSETQQSIYGLRLIARTLIKNKWSSYDLHELGISLRSIGVICLKLRGFFGYERDPFGSFGINKASFIN